MGARIEFLADAPPPAADPSPPPRRRGRWWLIAAVLVLAGVVVVRVSVSDDTAPTTAAPQPRASAVHPRPAIPVRDSLAVTYCYDVVTTGVFPPVAAHQGRVVQPGTDSGPRVVPTNAPSRVSGTACSTSSPRPCPRLCATVTTVPDPFLSAVRSRYPGARIVAADTRVLTGGRLWARAVVLRDGRERIRVVVRPRATDLGSSGQHDDGSALVSRVVVDADGRSVVVEMTAPSGAATDLGRLSELAHDRRLAALA